ncbi:hypothetical protein H0X06_02930 [Candidatus Dependentiae bacterium]|nr:hypothetical protein [Candidatus Dependentiae bacterium]
MDLTTRFYYLDEFCKSFEKCLGKRILSSGKHITMRAMSLSLREVMTLMIHYHVSGFKTFKNYYMLRLAFPTMPRYNRFIELQQKALISLTVLA